MANRIQIRRDISSNWTSANPILAQGEMGLETDTSKFKFGDGTTAWSSLTYNGSTYLTSIAGLNHNSLGNLTTGDVHTQYALGAGRSGGQTVIGGTAVTDTLNIQGTSGNGTSTSTAIKALVGNNGATEAVTILNNGNVGFQNPNPSVAVEIGSTTMGENQIINSTYGTPVNVDFVAANWTLTAGWEATNDTNTQLDKNADGVTTATYTLSAPTSGSIYKVVTVMNASVTGGCTVSYGGINSPIINPTVGVPTTFTHYIKTTTVGNIIITPIVTSSRFVITSIIVTPLTTGTGDSTIYGNQYLAGTLQNPSGTIGIRISPNGAVIMGANLAINGVFSGATTVAASTSVTITRTGLATTSTDGNILVNTTASTAGATVQITPRLRFSGTVWDTGSTTSKSVNFINEVLPVSGNPGSGNLKWSYDYNGGGYTNIMSLSSGGNLGVGVGVTISARMHAIATTEQLRLGYDASNYMSTTIGSTGSVTLALTGTSPIFTFSQGVTINGLLTLSAQNLATDTTTGMKIGTTTGQKIAFWNKTPIVQPTTAYTAATFVVGAGTAVNDASTFDGYTLKQVVAALRGEGLLA